MKKILLLLLPTITFGQVNFPTVPQPTQFQNYGRPNFGTPTNPRINIQDLISDPMQNLNQEQQIQNEKLIREAQQRENQREQQMREVYRDINKSKSNINYNLPSNSDKLGTEFYRT
ncbi:TPA: hypothetical protein ACGFUW_002646, partial [Flavobacterium psychrophilum]